MTAAVRIRDLRYRYRGGDTDVLRLGTLEIDGPGLVAVVGRTGVGKTTLMELLAGTLREPYHGSMQVLGVELRTLRRDADRQRHLRRVGLIPQDFGLLPGASVRDILHQDLVDAEVPAVDHAERVAAALDRVGMLAYADRNSEQLSGGQRQRIAIARTLARDVDLVIADEPTANLDPAQAESIVALFEEIGAGRPVIIVTHDMSLAARCGRIVVLRPLIHGTPAAPSAPDRPAPRRHRLGAAGGLLLLVAATVGSGLAVRVTNAHRTPPHPATAVARAVGGAPRATAAATPVVPVRIPIPAAVPGAPPIAPRPPEPQVVQVVQVVNRTPPGGAPPPAPAPGPTQPPVAAAPPAASSPSPAPRMIAPYIQIGNQRFAVCTGGDCSGSFVEEPDWSAGVPSYYDAAGSIIGDRHRLAAGVEVDVWSGTALTRYQVLGSLITENWGRPGPTTPPAGTALQLGGIDQANVCTDPRCAAPYFTTYVFLATLG